MLPDSTIDRKYRNCFRSIDHSLDFIVHNKNTMDGS
jgi:hypothetical protein